MHSEDTRIQACASIEAYQVGKFPWVYYACALLSATSPACLPVVHKDVNIIMYVHSILSNPEVKCIACNSFCFMSS